MDAEALILAREASYRGDGTSRRPAVYNTAEELLALREAGYLIGPDTTTLASRKIGIREPTPDYAAPQPGEEATPRHWTAGEHAHLARAYSQGQHATRIQQAFPVEAAEIERIRWLFSDPDLA